jgi:hypothetical protein
VEASSGSVTDVPLADWLKYSKDNQPAGVQPKPFVQQPPQPAHQQPQPTQPKQSHAKEFERFCQMFDSGKQKPPAENIEVANGVWLEQKMTKGAVGGQLPKWLLRDSGGAIYAKGRVYPWTLEPEAEVCASRLAALFGISVVEYYLVKLPSITKKNVCVSRDFTCGREVIPLVRYIAEETGIDAGSLFGAEKLRLVESAIPNEAFTQADAFIRLHRGQ